MPEFSYPSGPAIQVAFSGSNNAIQQVRLSTSYQDFGWTIHPEASKQLIDSICRYMEAYAQKNPLPMNLPLADDSLSPFTQQVLRALLEIPFGSTITYQELAKRCGQPKAYRAAGSACGRNPFPLLIPCHRVKSLRGLGGFSAGLPLKESLLAFESPSRFKKITDCV